MAAKKPEYKNWTSPKGVAKYCHLAIPQTKYKPEGVFSVQMVYHPDDVAYQTFHAHVMTEMNKAFAVAKAENPDAINKSNLFTRDTNKDAEGNKIPTGNILVKFAHAAKGTRKDKSVWEFKPFVYDSAGNHAPKGIVVFGGSVLKVSYSIKHTLMPTGDFYTSLQLQAAQIITLVDAMVRSASEFGFGKEEGYVADEDSFGEPVQTDAEAEDSKEVVVGDF